MQPSSNEGETVLVSVESTGMLDDTLSVDGSQEQFKTAEASLYHVLRRRTTANEPLRRVQPTPGQRRFEAWHTEVRSEERVRQKKSARAA